MPEVRRRTPDQSQEGTGQGQPEGTGRGFAELWVGQGEGCHGRNVLGMRAMNVRKLSITEDENTWTVTRGSRPHGVYQTAFDAFQAIKDEDSKTKDIQVTIIEWTTHSRVGKLVIQVLANSNPTKRGTER
jgi:hypothetical protein